MLSRIGYYCWAGPGTERIIKTKYFNPKIDKNSLFKSYDYEYLVKVKGIFGITDAWISYSWGFSDKVEKEDHEFTLKHLENFKKLKIKTHAYLQGCNLVYENFKDQDFWCRDEKNRLVTYYKGRKVTCVNNPNFRNFFRKRLSELVKQSFDGIYIDNIQMGQLGVPMPEGQMPFVFAGCRCKYCQQEFKDKYKKEIPIDFEKDLETTKEYLNFRVDSINNFIAEASKTVHSKNKTFGTNSYDPKFNTRDVYGFDVDKIKEYQDYLLFENHALSNDSIENEYINKITIKSKKPVFVVSYKYGIGFDKQFSQKDFNLIYSEVKNFKFYPVIKASEYVTNNTWHNLFLDNLDAPNNGLKIKIENKVNQTSLVTKILRLKFVRKSIKNHYNQTYTLVMENRYIRPAMKLAYELVLH